MYPSNSISALPCFGTPHVQSSGSLRSCYYSVQWSVVSYNRQLDWVMITVTKTAWWCGVPEHGELIMCVKNAFSPRKDGSRESHWRRNGLSSFRIRRASMGNPIASSRFFQDLKAFEDEASTFIRNVWIRLHRVATPFPAERTQHAAPLPATTQAAWC
jgi:hypothetical protein